MVKSFAWILKKMRNLNDWVEILPWQRLESGTEGYKNDLGHNLPDLGLDWIEETDLGMLPKALIMA